MFKKFYLFILMGLMILCTACSDEDVSDERVNLSEYYGYSQISGKDTYIVIFEGNVMGMGFLEDGEIYVPYDEFRKNVDKKCYIDINENLFVYSTANNIYDSSLGSSTYTEYDGKETDYGHAIAKQIGDKYYILAKFIKEMGNEIDYKTVESPNRVVMTATWKNMVAQVKEDTNIRVDASERTKILASLKKGDSVNIVSEEGEFKLVTDTNGVTGFVKSSLLGEQKEEEKERENKPAAYTHLTSEEKICLGWHQMAYETGNDEVSELLENAEPLNVISPTWYTLADGNGNINSLSDESYVEEAHNRGVKVWALADDFAFDENDNPYVTEVLSHTSTRRMLIKNLIEDARETGVDGINVDFENIRLVIANDYVQFICEMSVWCRKEGLVLSVDMYVPSDINLYYDRETVLKVADYLVIMGYDEHWAGCDEAGSVASLPYVVKGIEETIAAGDNTRVINAIPFFTRIWQETPIEFAEDGSTIVDDPVLGSYALDSRAVGIGTAEKELEAHGANKFWVEDVSQYYGEYEEGNSLYRVWLEDEKSIGAKLEAMKEYNLGGIACWRLGLEEEEIWGLIDNSYLK